MLKRKKGEPDAIKAAGGLVHSRNSDMITEHFLMAESEEVEIT